MDKRLRINRKGTIGFLAVSALLLWMWLFFRSYLLFMLLLMMVTAAILSVFSLWLVRDRIRAEIVLPCRRVGKNTDIPAAVRVVNPMRFVGFAVDVTYRFGNLFTGGMEEKREKLWAAPRKGAYLQFRLNSRYAGSIRAGVEECKVYDLLHLFYLTYRPGNAQECLAWPVFSDGEDTEERYENIEGFPKENESRRQGTAYNPDYEIREYVAGDALKSVHWKLSAKQGKLMVRERLAAGKEQINVLLPLGEDPEENDALMESLYGMCRLLLSREYPVRLFWQGVNDVLCSRFIAEQGELENAIGEILSTNGIHASASIEEQMAIEHPAEHYILCRRERKRPRAGNLTFACNEPGAAEAKKPSLFHKRKKENPADVSLVRIPDQTKYDLPAALAKSFLLFSIVYGAVGGFLAAFEIEFHTGRCMFSLFALAFFLCAVYETGKRWAANLTTLLAFLVYVYIAVTNYWVINSGYYYILNRIFEVARDYFDLSGGMEYSLAVEDGYMAVTTFAIFLGMVGIILLNIQLHNKCSLFRVMVLTLTPYVIPMYFECLPPPLYRMLILTGCGAVMMLSYGRGRVSGQMRYMLPTVAAAAVLLVSAASLIMPEASYARVVPQSEAKEASEKEMERFAQYGMLALFPQGAAGSGVSGGRLSKSAAIMPGYETALTVMFTPYSFQPVYLKAFTGLDYTGTSWTEAGPEWPEDGNMEESVYSRQCQFADTDGGADQGLGIMEVERADADDTFEYRPYYTDCRNIEKKDNVLIYQYYPDNGESVLLTKKEPYIGYLEVPSACETAVRRVCEEAGFGGTEEEIARQITMYFDENYDYTLRPGFYYGDPDYISHFLLESRKGYCAHFASSAVMLFRQMGIPARYVEGYSFSYADVVENGELVEGAGYDDYYRGFSQIGATAPIRIEIPEAYAHAWVEIYDSERGWLVVDPTPSSGEAQTTSFWDAFTRFEGGGNDRRLGEDKVGGYIENALGALVYAVFGVSLTALILLAAIRLVRRERERRLPGRERVKLEYGRLRKAAAGKNREFWTLRTLGEQIAWMRENCRVEISDAQEEALYQAFFAENMNYDCDRLCRELKSCIHKR